MVHAGLKEMPGGSGSLLAGEWAARLALGDAGGVRNAVRGWLLDAKERGELGEDACREAVSYGGSLLGDVPEELRTEAVCIEAAWSGRDALAFVPEGRLTAELCGRCVAGEVLRGTSFDDPDLWAAVPEDLRDDARQLALDRLYGMGLEPEDMGAASGAASPC